MAAQKGLVKKKEAKNSSQESPSQPQNDLAVQLMDSRPEAVQLQQLQESADSGIINGEIAQLQATADISSNTTAPFQFKENNTGLPDNLKLGMENLSGMSLDHVKVHRNSDKPAAVQAHAYAQGSDIHLASGQEKHLPHELGHVVQQAQGRVKSTTSVNGMAVNDNTALEREADSMGAKALQRISKNNSSALEIKDKIVNNSPVQLKWISKGETGPHMWNKAIDGLVWFAEGPDKMWYNVVDASKILENKSSTVANAGQKKSHAEWTALSLTVAEPEPSKAENLLDKANDLNEIAGLGVDISKAAVNDGKKATDIVSKGKNPDGTVKMGKRGDSKEEANAGKAGDIVGATLGFAAAAKNFKDAFTSGAKAWKKKPKDVAQGAGAFKSGADGIKSSVDGVYSILSLAGDSAAVAAKESADVVIGPLALGVSMFVNIMNMMQNQSKWNLVQGLDKGKTLSEDEVKIIQTYVKRLDRQLGLEIVDFIFNISEFIALLAGPSGIAVAGTIKIIHGCVNLFKGACNLMHGYFVHKEKQAEGRVSGGKGGDSLDVDMASLESHLNSDKANDGEKATDSIKAERSNNIFGLVQLYHKAEMFKKEKRELIANDPQADLKPLNQQIKEREEIIKKSLKQYNETIKPEGIDDFAMNNIKDLCTVHMNVVNTIVAQTREKQFNYSWLKSKVKKLGKQEALEAIEKEIQKKEPTFSWATAEKEFTVTLDTLTNDKKSGGYFEQKTMDAIHLASNRKWFSNEEIEGQLITILENNKQSFESILIKNSDEFKKLSEEEGYKTALTRFIKL